MANNATIAHRFANKDFGKYGTLQGSSTHIEGRNYYSYGTIFGQWGDIANNVCVIYTGSTSKSSSKHQLHKGMFPSGTHVFPYDDGGNGYYYYHGCNLVSWLRNDEDFTYSHRLVLLDYFVKKMYDQFASIVTGRCKGLENVKFVWWDYVQELCGLYKDTSVSKYLKSLKGRDADIVSKRKMVKLIASGERDVETITDAMFGAGSYKKYWDYCARFRKAADKRRHIENICKYLGIHSPYESSWGQARMHHDMTANDIRNLTASERLAIKWKALEYKRMRDVGYEEEQKNNKRMENAYRWIVGCAPEHETWWHNRPKDNVTICTNKYTGEVYECGGYHIYGVYWIDTQVRFDYDAFRQSDDKQAWIAEFYDKCKVVSDVRRAHEILREKGIVAPKVRSWEEDKYTGFNAEGMSEEERELCAWYIAEQDRYYHDKELRERAERLERERRAAEAERERIFREQADKQRIDQLLAEGVTGIQNIWREHLASIEQANQYFHEVAFADEQGAMYDGGNVLLRFSMDKTKVETSKGVRIDIDVCKAMWKYVKAWHENPASFKEREINTKLSGKYTIVSYEHDILTAGCHQIAFSEMQRMYNEIMSIAA